MPQDTPPVTPETPQAAPAGAGRRLGLRVLVLVMLAPLVCLLIAAALLIDRDIAAPRWVTDRITEHAAGVLVGGTVDFDEVFIKVGRDLHPRLQLRGTVLRDAAGQTIARVEHVEGQISPRGLLFRRALLVQDVTLRGVQIDLRRDSDGMVAVAFDGGVPAVGQAGGLVALLDQLDQQLEKPVFEALEAVAVSGVILNFQDARAGKAWTIDDGRFALDFRSDQIALRGNLAVLSGRAGVTTLALSYASPVGSRAADIGLAVTDAIAADIATQAPALSWLGDVDAPISANLRTSLDENGALGQLSASLEIGSGILQPNAATAPIAFDGVKTYLTYAPETERIQFDQIEVISGLGRLEASGQAFLRDFAGGFPRVLVGQFRLRDLVIDPGTVLPEPVAYSRAQLDLRLRLRPFAIDVGQFYLGADSHTIRGSARLAATPDGWEQLVQASSETLTQDAILKLWPPAQRPGTRDWVLRNLSMGAIPNAHFVMRAGPDQPVAINGAIDFAQTTIRVIQSLPPISQAQGSLQFGDHAFSVVLDDGVVTPPEGGALRMAGSTIVMPDTRRNPTIADLDLNFEGTMTATMSLLDQPPFGYASAAGLAVDFADARVRTDVQITMPIAPSITKDDVDYTAVAELRDVRTTQLVPDQVLTADRLRVEASKAEMSVTGRAQLGVIPAQGQWRRVFDGSGGSRLTADIGLSQAFLDTYGIALPPGSVTGQGTGQLDIRFPAGVSPLFTLTSDLRGIGVAIPPIGWAKPQSTQGSLRVSGALGNNPTIDRLAISGGGLNAQGRIVLNRDGSLDRAVFSEVRVDDWLQAPITLRGRGAGRPVGVEIRGGQVDLRRARFGPSSAESGPLSIALDRLQITQGIALSRFIGEFQGAGGFAGTFSGQINGEVGLQGTVAPRNGRSAVRLQSNDAGGVARAAGLIRNAVGGSLDVTLLPAGGEGTFDGQLAVRGLRLRDAPTMAALLDAVSVVGLLQQLDGQGLSFDEVDASFRLTPNQVILTQSSAVGPGLGISLDGIYTLATRQMDFQGVISPFYLINSIGSVLTRRGEGLIGFSFNVTGVAEAPLVSVNPFSALTPGMFREIFRRPPPEVAQ